MPEDSVAPEDLSSLEDSAAPDGTVLEDPDPAESPAEFYVHLLPAKSDDCATTVAAQRQAQTDGTLREALAQLLAGPSTEEQAAELHSWFSSQTAGMLNTVTISSGLAEVDFTNFSDVMPNASTSCGSTALLAQLDRTVLQFGEIDRVVYSFDGDRVAFYEWLQLAPPESTSRCR